MTKRAQIDIIIPVYNQVDLTLACLDSIYLSTVNYRLLVIDNGSQPEERDRVCRALRKHSVFSLVCSPENIGFVKAVNAGIALSTSEYFVILNNDTRVVPGWLDKLADVMDREPRAGIIGPMTTNKLQWQGDVAHVTTWGLYRGKVSEYYLMDWDDAMVAFFCAIVRRDVVRRVGYLSEAYGIGLGDDDDYCYRLRKAGYVVGLRRDLFVHHEHRSTFKTMYDDNTLRKMEQDAIALFKRTHNL